MEMMNILYRRAVGYIMQTKIYRYLLKHVIPYIRFTTYYTNLRGKKYHALYEQLKAGDVILTIDKKKLTTLLIRENFLMRDVCKSG